MSASHTDIKGNLVRSSKAFFKNDETIKLTERRQKH